jgi:hypothetical protein
MPITNSVKGWYAGGGSPSVYFANQNFNITNGNTTISCPVGANVQTNQVGNGPVRVGFVRVKTESVGTFINTGNLYPNAALIRVLNIWGDDGSSNVVQIYSGDASATVANLNIDEIYEFSTDIYFANINVAINVTNINATGNAVMSVEVAAGP